MQNPKASWSITRGDIRKAYKVRDKFADKNSAGRLLIVGGSDSYYGAASIASNAAFNSLAALRAGAGYVSTFVPKSILSLARRFSPNAVIRPAGEKQLKVTKLLSEEIKRADCLVIGMGLGRDPGAIRSAHSVISAALKSGKKVVVDAEAIGTLKSGESTQGNLVATPNDREFQKFSGTKPNPHNVQERIGAASRLAKRLNAIVVMKGHYTVITDGKRTKVNYAKHAALATMGSGDVLDGMIGAFAAIGTDAFSASVAGVSLHSQIGEMLFKKMGNHIIANDVVENIPDFLKKFDR